ncbi:hypothetical protein [Marilutibacter spongiae]|nr:hypothetical protein [Lysobacter spongiae]
MCVALLVATTLSALACLGSGLPPRASWPIAVAALAYGLHQAHREWGRPPLDIVLAAEGVRIDGAPVDGFEVVWRGPLVVASWRGEGGRPRRRAWLPDTLPAADRRELRLALIRVAPARNPGSMAP